MQYRTLGRTGYTPSAIVYGGIVSAKNFGGATIPGDGQAMSDHHVEWAIERGINYFDVAPTYGDAQKFLGNSLQPYRDKVYLACKTKERTAEGAKREIEESMKLLHTDHFDIYQLHEVSSIADIESAFAPGGCMELLTQLKKDGVIRQLGFSAHSEDAAMRALELYDYDTILFPVNWLMNKSKGMGDRILKAAKERNMGVIGMKAFVERAWDSEEEQRNSVFPKSWCKPFDIDDEAFGMACMRYALKLGADVLVPPGNFESFSFGVEHIEQCLAEPFGPQDEAILNERFLINKGREFFQI